MARTLFAKIPWILISMVGLGLIRLEIGLVHSGSQDLGVLGVAAVIGSAVIGVTLLCLGLSKFRDKPRWQ